MAYWSPERSLANAANGGFLPSGPSAPADCWAMGCIASELVSGVFVQERLASSSSLSLAQEPKVVAAFLRAIPHAASSHQGGQAAAKGGDGETCAALRTAWVMVGLLERDPMRRLEAGRAAFLLENPTWVPAPEATTVGSSRCITGPVMVPALSIPPPSRRRRGDSGDGEASSVSHMLPGVDMLSAVRRAIDGPDWRVFKDGKLMPNESQWHHDDLTTARSRERRASSPHPRAIRTMHAAENDGRIPQAMDDGGDGIGSVVLVEQDTDGQTAPSAPLSVRQRERAERQQTRRGLADLYLQAKQKQFPGADDNRAKANAPSRDAAIHASSERRNANGVDAAAPPVPLSSLKEDKAKRRGHGDRKCDARAATASALPPALLSSLPDASKRPYDMQAQDVWHAWLKSLGADVPDSEGEEEEDTPSQSASSAHAWSEDEQDEDNEAVDVGEMGPQEVADADMQVKDFLSPRLLVPDSRGTTRGNGVGLTVAGGDDEQEDAAQGRRGWVGGRGQEEHEPAGSNADGMKGDAGNRERQTVGSSLSGRNEETAAVSKTENFLSQHLVSVKNVAGNTVHVIGAAAPASEEETDTHSAPGRPHSQSVGQFSASSPNPHPSPDDEEDGTSGAPEEGRGGIVAKGVGGAEVEIKAKLLTSRSVGGDGGSGAGTGDGREVYTAFVLSCEGAGVEWQVCRRYSEFSELHLKLMSSLPPAKGRASRARAALSSRMPKKVMFGSNLPHVVAERLEKLRSYVAALQRVLALQALTNAKDAEKACEAWVQFCAVPSTAFAAAALGRSGHGLAASVAGASSPPHPAAVNALNLWAASAKPPLRGVLRRGALPGERQEAAKNKKVVVEEGRRQVVWGTDGVLQLDANTFIFGTPERLPGEYMKAAKKGIKSHRRAVDPAGPFLVGWWEDEALSDPPAQTEADDRAHRSVSADAAPAVAQPASKLDASLASLPDSSPGKKSAAAQACMGDGEAPVLAVRGELLVRKQDGQGSRTLSLLRDLDHVSRGRGPDRSLCCHACFSFACALLFVRHAPVPLRAIAQSDTLCGGRCCCREHTHELRGKATETKEQLTQATPLTLVTTLAPTNSALPTSNLRTRSSSTTPTTPPSSHPWIFLHEKWPAGSSEQGREQKKDSIEQGRDQDKEATSALAPTGMHLVAGRDLGRATISSGGSGSSWMSMRMAGRFGPPLPPLPPASEAPGRPGDTPPAARAAGSWDHADIMSSRGDMSLRTSEENPHARSAAPAGVSVLTGNGAVEVGAVEMGAERTGQGRAGASNLEIAASNVASSSHDMHVSSSSHGASNLEIAASNVGRAKGAAQAPLLELDEDLVQASLLFLGFMVVFGDGLPRRHGWLGTADARILAHSLTYLITHSLAHSLPQTRSHAHAHSTHRYSRLCNSLSLSLSLSHVCVMCVYAHTIWVCMPNMCIYILYAHHHAHPHTQMEESLRKAKQVFATSNDAAPLSLQLEHKLASETLLAKTPLRHSAGSDDFLGGSVNGFRDHAFGAEMGEEEEEAVGLSADDLAALRDLDVAAATARKHDLEARLSHITQVAPSVFRRKQEKRDIVIFKIIITTL